MVRGASSSPRRLDEVPTLEVVAQVLAGIAGGLLLILLGRAIRTVDDAQVTP